MKYLIPGIPMDIVRIFHIPGTSTLSGRTYGRKVGHIIQCGAKACWRPGGVMYLSELRLRNETASGSPLLCPEMSPLRGSNVWGLKRDFFSVISGPFRMVMIKAFSEKKHEGLLYMPKNCTVEFCRPGPRLEPGSGDPQSPRMTNYPTLALTPVF
jgi:hypothetical protein